ncbi:hypothetical protein G6F66_005749 [Rhizopus arrhizus]|nr:hypothetical protein G6F66_005749 [Rhizopus arrhizus]
MTSQNTSLKQITQHPTLTRRPVTRYKAESELHEEQDWKKDHYVYIVRWIIEEAKPTTLEDDLYLLIPPVLIILDDFDIQYKTIGVGMVHTMITRMSPSCIIKSHLDNVFLESLFSCLSYLTQERDVPLLAATYPCLLDLIACTKKQGPSQCALYERVLIDGIATGLLHAGEKIQFLPILLEPIPALFDGLGVVGVQYLKMIIPPLCESVSRPASNPKMKKISVLAANGLRTVMKVCWPRIYAYEGVIFRSLAKAWSFYYEKQDTDMLALLKQVYRVFEAACQGKERADKEALLKYKPSVFGPLLM